MTTPKTAYAQAATAGKFFCRSMKTFSSLIIDEGRDEQR